ncbi:MAG: hypothetical protein IJP79_07270 [Paludibacteraceae bacterium]|nr:hypothetical protein [Paludibacteraceae bacterium]MBQ6963484.1 hypothetical protein [Paludibacteraceae bacterium]MBQ7662502.1 hypothetical protein [Prevotella sp.]MBQ7748273.1 hypothetical protein [Paludibacteraceae bacterium]
MPQANLIREQIEVEDGLESIVIVNALGDIPGGRTLDVTDVAAGTTVIKAGHIIIASNKGVMKPMPLNGGGTAYGSLPANHTYVGVLKATVTVKDPRAAIVTMGQVNQAACPFTVTDAMKTALKNIQFLY